MLILTQRVHETIVIQDDIRVTVVRVKGNQVRLGIEAPEHVKIRREELEPEEATNLRAPEEQRKA